MIHQPSADTEKEVRYFSPSVFLAGTIDNGNSLNWQQAVASTLETEFSSEISIFNPRNEVWDPDAPTTSLKRQIRWELEWLTYSDVVLFNFMPNSTSVVSMLELGFCLKSARVAAGSKSIVVCCPESYYRYTNVVETVCFVRDTLEHPEAVHFFSDMHIAMHSVTNRLRKVRKEITDLRDILV